MTSPALAESPATAAVDPRVAEETRNPRCPLGNEERRATLGPLVCQRVARGQLVKEACARVGVSRRTFRDWMQQDAGLRAAFERARIDQAHALAEETLRISDSDAFSMEAVQRNRLRVDTRKWYVSKIAPALFGDRIEHSHKHTVGVVMLPPVAGQATGIPDRAGTGSLGTTFPNDSPSHARAFLSAGPVLNSMEGTTSHEPGTWTDSASDTESVVEDGSSP